MKCLVSVTAIRSEINLSVKIESRVKCFVTNLVCAYFSFHCSFTAEFHQHSVENYPRQPVLDSNFESQEQQFDKDPAQAKGKQTVKFSSEELREFAIFT